MVVSTCSFGARRSSSSWSAAGVFQIQTDINMTAAARHVAQFFPRRAISDPGYVIKTILTEAFGGPVLRPWALRAQRQQHAVIVAYSSKPIDEITSRLGLALPSVRTCVGEVFGYPVPELAKEQRLRYTVRLCPTIRSTNRGETDAFLLAADMVSPDAGLTRDAIYREYLPNALRACASTHAGWKVFNFMPWCESAKAAAALPRGNSRTQYFRVNLLWSNHRSLWRCWRRASVGNGRSAMAW
jgi:hypothetical protein